MKYVKPEKVTPLIESMERKKPKGRDWAPFQILVNDHFVKVINTMVYPSGGMTHKYFMDGLEVDRATLIATLIMASSDTTKRQLQCI